MPGSEAARPAADERLLYAQRGPLGVGQGIVDGGTASLEQSADRPRDKAPAVLPAGWRRFPVVTVQPPEGLGSLTTTRRRHRPRSHPPATAPCPGHLLPAAAFWLLEVIAADAP